MANYPPLFKWLLLATFFMSKIVRNIINIYNILAQNVTKAKLCIELILNLFNISPLENTFLVLYIYLTKGVIVIKQYEIRAENIPFMILKKINFNILTCILWLAAYS